MRSLWIRLIGAFAAVITVMLAVLIVIVNVIARREYDLFVLRNSQAIIRQIAPVLAESYIENGDWQEAQAILTNPVTPRGQQLPQPGRGAEQGAGGGNAGPRSGPMGEHMAGMMGDPDVWAILGFDMVLADSNSTVVADTSNTRIRQQLSAATLNAGTQIIVNGLPVGTLLVVLPDSGAVRSNEFLTEVRRGVWVAAIAAGAVALVMGTLIFQRMIRPLRDLQKAAQRVAQGDLTARVDGIAGDEIGEVGLAFNQMAQNLSDQQTLRKQMVADIAHELRNPISVMQGTLEAMQDGLITPDPGEIQELHSDVRRLARLVEDLRTLSLADAGQLTLRRERINPAVLAEHVVSRMGAIAAERGVSLTLEALPDTPDVDADEDRLTQVLGNLVDNALRHTPRGGHVRVRVAQQPGEVQVEVVDDGPGIAAGDLPYVFERFWRGDRSRSRDSGGSGLGLAIVRQLTELHGGRVSVDSAPGRGTTFRVILPALLT